MQLIERQGQMLPADFSPVRANARRCTSLVRERTRSTTSADYSNWPPKAENRKKTMSETVLVLRADRYEFTSDKTGEIIKGCNVYFTSDSQVETANAVGEKPMKVSITDEVFNEIKHYGVPGHLQHHNQDQAG